MTLYNKYVFGMGFPPVFLLLGQSLLVLLAFMAMSGQSAHIESSRGSTGSKASNGRAKSSKSSSGRPGPRSTRTSRSARDDRGARGGRGGHGPTLAHSHGSARTSAPGAGTSASALASYSPPSGHSPKQNWKDAAVAVLFVGNNAFSVLALKYVSLPMFGAIRRMLVAVVLILQYMLYGRLPEPMGATLASVVLICVGALTAGMADAAYSFEGYALTGCSMVCAAGYLVALGAVGQSRPFAQLLRTNVSSCVVALTAFLVFETLVPHHMLGGRQPDVYVAAAFATDSSASLLLTVGIVVGSAAIGFLLNYSLFVTTTESSPLTATIVGNAKALLTDVLGSLLFADVTLTVRFVSGIALTLLGISIYSWGKYTASHAVTGRGSDAAAVHDPDLALAGSSDSGSCHEFDGCDSVVDLQRELRSRV
ncbi:drug/Metabolite transporter superfamily protein [Thecamonas trahens ATCC 50062]|uniref:Drug/Metabolite transporter superfamily protein n=1 Tax=Thecamonas trahens ATCC 50062 TaxID=461836 RepID=A0A0L0D4R7_THETB|nr:drug/Metabolite transporter superfamily protein [Thecamonas trahens ATCC 50062]KNC47240.1 drug/Metabolite transporter superfamily protein [Thecamonas trahens ATCC 50062]|eukprot:XP_013759583.1 drug/Metabolite transporter superfamily protein [Thecamonas trahens ATCC 50062]